MPNSGKSPKRKEKKGRKGVPLSDASWGVKSSKGDTIDQYSEKRGGDETHDPTNPGVAEAKGYENIFDVFPAEFIKIFGFVDFEKHARIFGGFERVNDFMR